VRCHRFVISLEANYAAAFGDLQLSKSERLSHWKTLITSEPSMRQRVSLSLDLVTSGYTQ